MKKKLFSIFLAAVMVVGSPLMAFAYDGTTAKDLIPTNVVITTPDGREIVADNLQCIEVSSENVDENDAARISRNEILINENNAAPLFYAEGSDELLFADGLVLTEYCDGNSPFDFLVITPEQRNDMVDVITGNGFTFADAWYATSYFTVVSEAPISITYKLNGETRVMNNVTNGVYRLQYITPDWSENSAITGHLSFRHNGAIGTTAFTCGIVFKR